MGECACSAFTALQAARGVPPCVDLRDLSVGVIEKRECTGGVLPTCAVAPACCDMDGSGKIDLTNNTGVNECPNGFEAPPPPPGTPTPAPSLATFSNLVPLNDLLSSAPFIYNKLLLYTEFEPDPDGQVCTDDYKSRVYNLNTFTLGDPFAGGGVAAVGVMGAPYKEYLNTLVTGIDINPSSGAIFVQTSTPGNNPPAALAAPSLAINPAFAGWKQK